MTYTTSQQKLEETLNGLAIDLYPLPQEHLPGNLDSDSKNTANGLELPHPSPGQQPQNLRTSHVHKMSLSCCAL